MACIDVLEESEVDLLAQNCCCYKGFGLLRLDLAVRPLKKVFGFGAQLLRKFRFSRHFPGRRFSCSDVQLFKLAIVPEIYSKKITTTRRVVVMKLIKTPRAGFEPATNRLTVDRSTAELPRNVTWRTYPSAMPSRKGFKSSSQRWTVLPSPDSSSLHPGSSISMIQLA